MPTARRRCFQAHSQGQRAATGPHLRGRTGREGEPACGSYRLPTHRLLRAVHAAAAGPCDTHTNGLSAGRRGRRFFTRGLCGRHVQRVARQGMEKLPLVDRREDEEDANFQEAQSATFSGLAKTLC